MLKLNERINKQSLDWSSKGNTGPGAKDEWASPLDKRVGQGSYRAVRDKITQQGVPK